MADRGTYVDLDCFRRDDGRVMVRLDSPGHRLPEEFVPASERDRLAEALREKNDRLELRRLAKIECEKTNEHLRDALALIADHARLDLSERGIAEAERYFVIAHEALAHRRLAAARARAALSGEEER